MITTMIGHAEHTLPSHRYLRLDEAGGVLLLQEANVYADVGERVLRYTDHGGAGMGTAGQDPRRA